MIKRNAVSMVSVLGMAAALALAPLSAAGASSHHKKHHAKKHHKVTKVTAPKSSKGSNPGGSFCTEYRDEENAAENSAYEKSLTNAIESNNLAEVKSDFKKVEAEEGPLLQKAESLISQTPSNVQAAFKVITAELPKEYAAVQSATSMSGLESAFTSAGQSAAFTSASATVTNYVTSQCGSVTPTT